MEVVEFETAKAGDKKYLRKYFAGLDAALSVDKSDPRPHLARMTEHMEVALATMAGKDDGEGEKAGEEMDDAAVKAAKAAAKDKKVFAEYVTETILPLIMTSLLDREYMAAAHIEAMLEFVGQVIDAVVDAIRSRKHSDAFLRSLEPLVTASMDFYTKHGVESDEDVSPEERAKFFLTTGSSTQYAYIDSTDPDDSVYFARVISQLGERGLFDAIVERVACGERLESTTLLLFVRFAKAVEDDLVPAFLTSYLPHLTSAVLRYLGSLTADEAKTQDLEDLSECLNLLAKMSKISRDAEVAALNQALQQAKLDLALTYIELPFLAPSLKGMGYLRHLMAVAAGDKDENAAFKKPKRRGNMVSYYPAAYTSPAAAVAAAALARSRGGASASSGSSSSGGEKGPIAPPTLITIPFLLRWMDDQSLMERVLKAGHPEVVKGGSHILQFIAEHDVLSNDVLDSMWSTVLTGHESIQAKIFEVFLALIDVLPTVQVDYIYSHIQALEPERFDNQVLNFVSDFTLKAVAKAEDGDDGDGGDTGDAPGASSGAGVRQPASTYGLELFWNILLTASSDAVVRETCNYLQRLLGEFPAHREAFVEKCVANLASGTIVATSVALLSSILDSYTPTSLAEALVELNDQHSLLAVLVGHVASGSPAARDDLSCILALLDSVLTSSPLELETELANSLWDAGVALGASAEVIDWFYSMSFATTLVDPYTKERSYTALPDAVKAELFTSRIASLAPADVDAPSMRLYAAYFRDVNARAGTLRKISDIMTRTLAFAGIEGESFVWQVAAINADAEVATEALFILRDVYVNVDDVVPAGAARTARARATDAILAELAKGCQLSGPRMIWLLKELVVATRAKGALQALDRSSPGGRLVTSAFDTLFGLLAEPALMDGVWELLLLLPDEPKLASAVYGLPTNEAGLELAVTPYDPAKEPGPFTFHVFYVARMIKAALAVPGWAEAFVAHGGLEYLIGVFTTKEVLDTSNPAHVYGKRAASLLATLINAIFNAPGLMSAGALAASLDTAFIHNLMSQVAELAAPQPGGAISTSLVMSRPKPPSSSRGTLIANCHYAATPKVLRFEVEAEGPYQVAVYCVDYNTNRRIQSLTAYLGDDHSLGAPPKEEGVEHEAAVILSGPQFHNGQWVVWNVYGKGAFNIRIAVVDTGGPNWTFSAFLLDPLSPGDSEPPAGADLAFPTLAAIDSSTQGRWRGVYGSGGGVLLGKTNYPVPSSVPSMGLGAWTTNKASKYEWISELTSDPRAMQQVGAEPLAAAAAAAEPEPLASGKPEPEVDSTEPCEPELAIAAAASHAASADAECVVPAALLEGVAGSTSKSLIEMLFASVSSSADLVRSVLEYARDGSSFADWLRATLVGSADAGVRSGVRDGLLGLGATPAGAELRTLLEAELTELGALRASTPMPDLTQFFDVVVALEAQVATPPLALFEAVARRVLEAPILEDDDGEVEDTLLGGELRLLALFLEKHEACRKAAGKLRLEPFLFDVALFGEPESRDEPALPLCKSPQARAPAFGALVTLTLASDKTATMVAKLLSHLKSAALPTGEEWNVDPANPTGTTAAADALTGYGRGSGRSERSVCKYRGLKNQGCTCYMNASLQQMFLIRELRDAVLNVPLPGEASDDEQAKNIMFQLQLLFAHMQESKESYVDTIGFCRTVKMNGDFIRLGQQEDANEFLNGLVDQLEPHLKGTPQEHVFRDVFGGTYMNQIVSKECEHISERPEEYLTISVKVQGKRNLQEGLEFLVQGDMLDGDNKYHCEKCDAKVAANKRCVIQHLPNTLALHLCRFEFSFETFQNVKVNDRFEFPETLNMKPYTREGLALAEGLPVNDDEIRPDSYYEYQLAGVIIHSGTANAGHYFSYIRERDGEPSIAPWYEFNDRRVSPFAKDDLADKAFGGAYSGMSTHSKSFSGYMLFYERKERFAARVYDSVPLPPPSPVSHDPVILAKLWHDAIKRAQRRRLLGAPSLAFMWDVFKAAPPSMATVELGTSLMFDLLCHCAGIDDMAERMRYLQTLLLDSEPELASEACAWMLKQLASVLCDWLRNVLVKCPLPDVRDAASDLVIAVMARVAADEAAVAAAAPPAAADDEAAATKPPLVEEFGSRVVKVLRLAAYRSPKTTGALVRVLKAYAESGPAARSSLVGIGAVKELCQLYMAWKTPVMGSKSESDAAPAQLPLVELIVLLATADDIASVELSEADVEKLFEKAFVTAVSGVPAYSDLVAALIARWCPSNELLSDRLLLGISSGVNAYFDTAPQSSFAAALEALLGIDDELATSRATKVATGLLALLIKNLKLARAKTFIVALICRIALISQTVHDELVSATAFLGMIDKHASFRDYLRSDDVRPSFVAAFPELEQAIAFRDASVATTPADSPAGDAASTDLDLTAGADDDDDDAVEAVVQGPALP
ncbi:ubiquitin carboxyl-terminal hydrolase 34 [Thecamonas trahens ATCC 50062]|uniref:Ubiquitin carboxyl-terminal hydrolase 34 n=1 Tax=Thecamonas trahens ATCC 50062 TaxID=461836 RepID=A0A0L0D589_THETB|nr:ubiquitin carboxyl-terminal hydrolase 34 [Thecamonas trahens ATCC 50062]KNC47542.1 ubiquitin carboxyl-terminal hydrolase 34 [Thecamonas trahens ATCC 50062]|eukprot:XP_013759474.1 ubiquitin carboxyl-terminal hydrolase 34 [Thecamonas trahens ATCC 50062]